MKRLALILPAALMACGGDDTDATPDAGVEVGTDAVSDATVDAADAANDAAEDPGIRLDLGGGDTTDPRDACEANWVTEVNGEVVDTADAPVANAKSQLCVRVGSEDGNLLCLRPEDTDDAGAYRVPVPNSAMCMGGGSLRVFVPDGGYATTYCHVDTATDDGVLTLAEPVTLFETDAVEDLPAWGDPDAPRSITFPGGFEIAEFVPTELGFNFDESLYGLLGARKVDPSSEGLCFLDGEIDGLWAFAVEGDVARSFAFSFPNDDGFPAGATVNLYVLGGIETHLDDGTSVHETDWVMYDTAVVTEDGAAIEGRIPAFTWLGYALAEE